MPPEPSASPETGATSIQLNLGEPQGTPPNPATPTEVDEEIDPERLPGLKAAFKAERDRRKALEGQIKELEPLAKAAKDAEEANKSEVQKATEKLAKETEARRLAEQALMIQTVGSEKGVPANLIKFLTGTTKAEVEAAADELLSAMGDAKPSMPGRPTERMVNGKPSGNQLDGLDPVSLIRMGRGQSPLK
jgi:uncharacterized protein (DUF885 family)